MKTPWRMMTQAAGVLALVALGFVGDAVGQPPPGRPGGGRGLRQGLPVAEVERLFDGYVAMQAQEALQLSDAQYPQFLARLKALQETRRRNLRERGALLAQLNAALNATPFAEGQVRDLLGKVREEARRNADEVQKAYDAIDEVLDLRQQARFRVFEESVERRKFDLVLRARRSAMQRQER